MSERIDKNTLFTEIHAKYATLATLLAPLNEEQMTTPGVSGEWSIKDILAHLTTWHHILLDRLHAAAQGQEALDPYDTAHEELDTLNERFYKENKSRPLNEVLADFRTTHEQIVEAMQPLTDED